MGHKNAACAVCAKPIKAGDGLVGSYEDPVMGAEYKLDYHVTCGRLALPEIDREMAFFRHPEEQEARQRERDAITTALYNWELDRLIN